MLIPAGGFSAYDQPGEPFHDPAADRAFAHALRRSLAPHVAVRELPQHINDAAFAAALVGALGSMLGAPSAVDTPPVR